MIYLARLHTEKINPLLKEAFILSKLLDSSGTYSWYTFIKSFLNDNILHKIENCTNSKEVKIVKPFIKEVIQDQYKTLLVDKIKSYDENSKLFLYKTLKLSLDKEFYLSNHNFSLKKCFTKLRVSDHNLEIERGRYFNIPREERKCKFCGTLDNEEHFLLYCHKNKNLRKCLFENLNWDRENLTVLNLLNPKSNEHVKLIGSFLKQSLELRAEDAKRS